MFDLARPIWEQKTGLYIATAVHRWVWAMLTCILLWYLGWKIWMATTNIKMAKTEKMGNQQQVDPALQNRSARTLALALRQSSWSAVCSLCLCPLANIGKQVCTYIGTGTAAERWVCSPILNYNWRQLGWWPRFRQRIFTCTQVKLGWLRFRPYILKLKASSKSSQKPPIILYFPPKNRQRMWKLSSVHSEFRHFCHSQLNYVQSWC